jgi:hypothetical protein
LAAKFHGEILGTAAESAAFLFNGLLWQEEFLAIDPANGDKFGPTFLRTHWHPAMVGIRVAFKRR